METFKMCENLEKAKNNLLENAKLSIQLGIEDFKLSESDNKRKISSIRNIYAGLLLLYKYKLVTIGSKDDPFKLIDVSPRYKEVSLIPKKTITLSEIKEIFKSQGISMSGESNKKLDKINKRRNEIEHLYSNEDIIESINDCFILLEDFIRNNLPEQNNLSNFIGESNYTILVQNKKVLEERKKLCRESYNLVLKTFPGIEILDMMLEMAECRNCHSSLIEYYSGEYPDLTLVCDICKTHQNFDDVLYISHNDIKRGGSPTISECEECGGDYLYGVCLDCSYTRELIIDPDTGCEIDYESIQRMKYLMQKND
ncbi:hypothetical protein [Rodentibacter caecimuris]|uniref:hypothetical protein n=2 Tax=Rodentibacter caecimuris TaxID=1796644 RepID=UPI00211A16B4|nr:hypothetical protein [Rodentibacter heylii]MCQ9122685.1 hypothetical protein [Rodentibacter heylii]